MSAHESEDLPPTTPKLVRLQRYLASCGLGSRRACEDFITMGRVSVDDKVITEQGMQIDPQVNKIALDGEKLKMDNQMNKRIQETEFDENIKSKNIINMKRIVVRDCSLC